MASSCSICTSICWPTCTVTSGADIRKFPAQPPLASTFPSAWTQAGIAHELIPGGPGAPRVPTGTRPGTPRAASPTASPAAMPARAAHKHTMRRRPGLSGVRMSIMAVGRVPRTVGFRQRPNSYTGTALSSPDAADQDEPPRSRGAITVATTTRHGIVSPRRHAPSPGVATTTRRTSGPGYPSHRHGRPPTAHHGTTATNPRDARCQPRQPGAAVPPRAAGQQSTSRPRSGRPPPQHGHMRNSMATRPRLRAMISTLIWVPPPLSRRIPDGAEIASLKPACIADDRTLMRHRTSSTACRAGERPAAAV
jgi:hypothetical protein